MKKINLLILLMTSLIAISSCKKDDNSPDKAGVIVGKTWKMTAFTVDGKDEFTDFYEACERDNTEKYFADGRLVIDEGATKCDDDDPQSTNQKWEISGDKLTLSAEGISIKVECTIMELSDNTLKLSLTNPFGSEKYVYTYNAQ